MKKNKYITVLDFVESRVYQYKVKEYSDYIELGCGGTINKADEIDCWEEFIVDAGHSLNNCEWMVHSDSEIWADHSVGQVIMKECY